MRLFLIACCLWLGLTQRPAQADETMYPNTISCKTIGNVFLLMHMWKYYGEEERAAALVYLVHTRGSCTLHRDLHPALEQGTSIAEYEIDLIEETILVSLLVIPGQQAPEYVISNQLKE